VAEEDLPDQLPAAAHADLVEDGRQWLLDGVGRDRQRPGTGRAASEVPASIATTRPIACSGIAPHASHLSPRCDQDPAAVGGPGYPAAMAVIDWLLEGDPAIRWQVLRDLTDASADEVAAERARVEQEGWGARLLALEGADGLWDGGACFPAGYTGGEPGQPWTATMHTLQTLQIFGLDPSCETARRAIPLVAEHGRWEHAGQRYFDGEVEPCINGRTIETARSTTSAGRARTRIRGWGRPSRSFDRSGRPTAGGCSTASIRVASTSTLRATSERPVAGIPSARSGCSTGGIDTNNRPRDPPGPSIAAPGRSHGRGRGPTPCGVRVPAYRLVG